MNMEKNCYIFVLDGRFIGIQRANKQLKRNSKRFDTRTLDGRKNKCLVTGANRVVLFYNWSPQFYSLHFAFRWWIICVDEREKRVMFSIELVNECNKVATKPSDQRKQTIKWNCFVSFRL